MDIVLAPSKPTMAALVTLLGTLFTGCATVSPSSTPILSDTRRHYDSRAEEVFMYQSRVASRVLDRYAYLEIDGEADLDPTLAAAESHMADTCRYLNEAAVSRAEGRSPGWDLRLKVLTTTTACARVAREVEMLLENGGDSFATAKL